MEGPNVCDQIAFYSYQSFLMEVQSNAGYIQSLCSCIIATWRLGLLAPLVSHNNILHEGPKQVYVLSSWPCGPKCLIQHLFSSPFVLLRFFQWIFTKLESSVADEVKILLLSALAKVKFLFTCML